MFVGQNVSKVAQDSLGILGSIRSIYAMMKVDFDLSKTFGLKVSNHLEPAAFILFRRKKIRVPKGSAIVIANSITS